MLAKSGKSIDYIYIYIFKYFITLDLVEYIFILVIVELVSNGMFDCIVKTVL